MARATVVKMRSGLFECIQTFQIAEDLGLTPDDLFARLYRVASWFATHGKHGKIASRPEVIDTLCRTEGLAAALAARDWLRYENGVCVLRYFCYVSTKRKTLNKKLRKQILSSGKCAACGGGGPLQIDHAIPVSRGGSCETSNLQPLCVQCNSRKGSKTMEEFLHG